MKTIRFLLLALAALPVLAAAQTTRTTPPPKGEFEPAWSLKTNLLYDATGTVNLGAEFRTGGRTSIDIPLNYMGWQFEKSGLWKHFMAQPEFRLWTRRVFRGHFFGLNAQYALYNVGNLPAPFSDWMWTNRSEGWMAGAGVSYGYRWTFRNPRWGLEATVGVGYLYKSYDVYECGVCMSGHETKHYFGPTKAGLSLVYNFGKKKRAPVAAPPSAPAPVPVPAPAPAPVVEPPTPEPVTEIPQEIKTVMIELSNTLFAFDRFDLSAEAVVELDKVVAWLKENPELHAEVAGHTDSVGSDDYNLRLSERRAKAVYDYFVEHGIGASRLSWKGYGESRPVADNATAEGRRLNRRVELKTADRNND